MSIIHTVLSGANIGIFVLATLAFAIRFILGNRNDEMSNAADTVAYAGAGVGVLLAVLTGLSGYFLTWPQEAIRYTLLTQNKVLVATALLVCWGMFVALRWQAGKAMWQNLPMKLWALVLVAFGFLNVVLVGSLGGSASLAGTILDPALITLNLNRFVSLSWGVSLSVVLILVGIGAAAYPALGRKR